MANTYVTVPTVRPGHMQFTFVTVAPATNASAAPTTGQIRPRDY
jgi:hypothetical protein